MWAKMAAILFKKNKIINENTFQEENFNWSILCVYTSQNKLFGKKNPFGR